MFGFQDFLCLQSHEMTNERILKVSANFHSTIKCYWHFICIDLVMMYVTVIKNDFLNQVEKWTFLRLVSYLPFSSMNEWISSHFPPKGMIWSFKFGFEWIIVLFEPFFVQFRSISVSQRSSRVRRRAGVGTEWTRDNATFCIVFRSTMSKSPSLRRIQADIRELAHDPSDRYHAAPFEDDMFEWWVQGSHRIESYGMELVWNRIDMESKIDSHGIGMELEWESLYIYIC